MLFSLQAGMNSWSPHSHTAPQLSKMVSYWPPDCTFIVVVHTKPVWAQSSIESLQNLSQKCVRWRWIRQS
jgi:hypothetical protein